VQKVAVKKIGMLLLRLWIVSVLDGFRLSDTILMSRPLNILRWMETICSRVFRVMV